MYGGRDSERALARRFGYCEVMFCLFSLGSRTAVLPVQFSALFIGRLRIYSHVKKVVGSNPPSGRVIISLSGPCQRPLILLSPGSDCACALSSSF